ncbi:MAG TPA: hypothetical protein VNH46_07235 [Gemmatimonadales bacterium]|nr:hypothetical protein [Gemmatimonadales bacterium]
MTASARYWTGVTGVVLGAALVGGMLSPAARQGLWLALGLTLVIQAPLGWWLIVAVRAGRGVPVWVAGMASRLALVALTGLVIVPRLGWPAEPALVGLVALLLALLLVEGAVLWWEHFGSGKP